MDTSEFIERSNNIHNFTYDYSLVYYENTIKKVQILCKKHGAFYQSPRDHLQGKGCNVCRKSKGEMQIENILIDKNVKYIPQYSFIDLVSINPLKFDFAVIDENNKIKFLIEFNGEQHYKYKKPFYRSNQEFLDSQNRDMLKIDYCYKNNILLYIIKYDEDINKKMNEIL